MYHELICGNVCIHKSVRDIRKSWHESQCGIHMPVCDTYTKVTEIYMKVVDFHIDRSIYRYPHVCRYHRLSYHRLSYRCTYMKVTEIYIKVDDIYRYLHPQVSMKVDDIYRYLHPIQTWSQWLSSCRYRYLWKSMISTGMVHIYKSTSWYLQVSTCLYGVATVRRLLKMIVFFCQTKRPIKETVFCKRDR